MCGMAASVGVVVQCDGGAKHLHTTGVRLRELVQMLRPYDGHCIPCYTLGTMAASLGATMEAKQAYPVLARTYIVTHVSL